MTTTPHRMSTTEWGLLALLSLLWGGSFFFSKVAVAALPPLTVVLVRVALAAAAGLCGCTIEDTTADPATPIHGFDAAVARIRSAVAAARAAPHPFMLTARSENFLQGRPDLDDTIRRLAAFAEAGADCLYAPGLPDVDAIRAVVAAVAPKPVNVLSGPGDGLLPMQALASVGVRRVSVGGALARVAYGSLLRMGEKLRDGALPEALAGAVPHADIQALMARR